MTEIFIDKEIYKEVNSDFYSEKQFEDQVVDLIPYRVSDDSQNELICCELKIEFNSRPRNTIPDLIVFDKALSTFWIVEVELSKHSWSGHVEDQLQRLQRAEYSRKAEEVLAQIVDVIKLTKKEKENLKSLIEYQDPKFLLVVNKTPNWKSRFYKSGLNFEYIEIKTYVSENNDVIFSFDGDYLNINEEFSEIIPVSYYFEVVSPHIFTNNVDNCPIECSLDNKRVSFVLKKINKRCYLMPKGNEGREFLDQKTLYSIGKVNDNEFELREIKK